jgi:cation diffusion facilitator family transporter
MSGHGESRRAIIAALAANLGIAVSKVVGFVITGSASMLAEAIHSTADSGNQLLLLLGGRRARRAADRSHPFGYGRERYFWAFVVAMVLFSLGGAFAIFEGIEKIREPHHLDSAGVAVAILVVAAILEGFSFRTAVTEAQAIRKDGSWWSFIRRSRNPELPIVLLEDFGALIGLLLALTGVGLSLLTDDAIWDGIGTLAIGILLSCIAVVLAVEMKSLLIGEPALPRVEQEIVEAVEADPSVVSLIHLRTEHLGPEELLVCAKVSFRTDLTFPDLADCVDRVEAAMRDAVPSARVVYIEPDVVRTGSGGPPLRDAEDDPA